MEQATRTHNQLGAYIRRVRKAKGLTPAELGEQIRKRQATVSNLEFPRGRRDAGNAFCGSCSLDLELVVRPRTKSSARAIEDAF